MVLTLGACGRLGFDPSEAITRDAANAGRDAGTDGRTRMVPTYVQAKDDSVFTTSIAVAFDNDVVAGDLLVVAFGTGSELLVTMTDTTGDAFDMLPVLTTANISPMYVGYTIAGTSAAETVTAQLTGSDDATLRIHEYASVNPTTPLDTSVTNTGSSAGVDAIEVETPTATANEPCSPTRSRSRRSRPPAPASTPARSSKRT